MSAVGGKPAVMAKGTCVGCGAEVYGRLVATVDERRELVDGHPGCPGRARGPRPRRHSR
ncbi:MAG: hypothetical protein HOY79_03210 [Streptomyces sp.]|nr:hypothetical protein [Streptomyces sp.]